MFITILYLLHNEPKSKPIILTCYLCKLSCYSCKVKFVIRYLTNRSDNRPIYNPRAIYNSAKVLIVKGLFTLFVLGQS